MKIAIRGGHSLDVRGAKGIVDEVIEDRLITLRVIEYLKRLGHEVLDVTPGYSKTSGNDLTVAVNKANEWKADYFVSIHLNAFDKSARGTEVLYKSAKGKIYADRIVSKLASLGFANRGSKIDVRGLYEFKACVMPNNIIEVFFCDSKTDVDLYNKLGLDKIAKAIAEGITGQVVTESVVVKVEPVKVATPISTTTKINPKVKALQQLCNSLGIKDQDGKELVMDGINGARTEFAVSKLPPCGLQYTQKVCAKVIQGFIGAYVDGIWGNESDRLMKAYQKSKGLTPDGVCGKLSYLSFLK